MNERGDGARLARWLALSAALGVLTGCPRGGISPPAEVHTDPASVYELARGYI